MRGLPKGAVEREVEALLLALADDPLAETADLQVAISTSIAISLKRIAEAMATMSGPLNAYGETIGECIQGQHERGLRGIPNP